MARTTGRPSIAHLKLSEGDSLGEQLLMAWLERVTDRLIEKQWPQIQRLAAAVIEKEKFTGNGRFSGAEIKKVLA